MRPTKRNTCGSLQVARLTCLVLTFTWWMPVALGARVSREALNTVVAIGRTLDDGSKVWLGSGFMLLHAYRPDLQGEARYRAFIVTNKHVIARFWYGSAREHTAGDRELRRFLRSC